MKKLFFACLMLQLILSCSKKDTIADTTTPPAASYLKFTQQTLSLLPYASASGDVIIESNINWQVSASQNDWLQLSKTSGKGNDTIHVTVTKENLTAQPRSITLTAVPTDTTKLTAQITIEQKAINVQLAVARTCGGNGFDYINSLVKTTDGGLLIAGSTSSHKSGDVGGSLHGIASASDYWVAKLNSNLDTVWTRSIGGSLQDNLSGATLTSDGNFALAGTTFSNQNGDVGINHGQSDWYIVKLKSNGDTLWTRTLGGAYHDFAKGIAATSDGGMVVVGQAYANSNEPDVRVVKFNSNGDIVWQKVFGGIGIDDAFSTAITPTGEILVAGYTLCNNSGDIGASHGSADMWVLKLNSNGDKIWNKLYGGNGAEEGHSIAVTADGGCIVGGYSSSSANQDVVDTNRGINGSPDMWIVKLKTNGDIAWSNLLGSTDYDDCYGVAVTADGGCVAVGYASTTGGDVDKNQGSYDWLTVRLGNNGNKLWSKTYGATTTELATSVVVNADNSIYVGGYIYNTIVNGDVKTVRALDDGWLIKLIDY